MKVRVLRPALEDLASGWEFYNRQQEGIGDYFVDSLFSEVLARRFPYAVYYRILEGEAVVFRVLDCRRAPRWIRKSLKEAG